MTNEEIDAEIARLTALKEQNNKSEAIEDNKPADGIHNPADYIGQITNKMNKQSIGRGDGFSKSIEDTKNAGRRTGFEKDKDGTALPETAYEWITQQLNEARARGPINKYTLKAIENGAKVRYNVPANFNISGPSGIVGFLNRNTERNMARAMNSMPYNGNAQKPAQPAQAPAQSTQTAQAQNPQPAQAQNPQPAQTQDISPKTKLDNDRTAAYKRIKSKQASDADLAMFKDYTEEQLKNIGFGPVSIAAIKDAARQTQQVDNNTVRGTTEQMKADIANGNVKPTYNENSILGATQEELDAMKAQGLSDDLYNKGMQAIKNSNGLSSEEKQFMQQYNKAAGSRKPEDRAFLTPENAKRYSDLIKKQKEVNKVNKQNKRNKSIAAAKQDNATYGDVGTFGE